VKFNGRIEKVSYEQLLFIEASLNYVTLHTVNGKMIVYLTFKGIMENLPADQFIKVHKSFIVNVQKIDSIAGNVLRIGKEEIPVSQKSHDEVMSMILKDKMLKR
jgi:DNA-binding LytR/AlgR family response regulator